MLFYPVKYRPPAVAFSVRRVIKPRVEFGAAARAGMEPWDPDIQNISRSERAPHFLLSLF